MNLGSPPPAARGRQQTCTWPQVEQVEGVAVFAQGLGEGVRRRAGLHLEAVGRLLLLLCTNSNSVALQ